MSRTYRKIPHWEMPYNCMRRPKTTNERRAQAMLNELVRDDSLDFVVNLGNRALHRHITHAWEDECIAALDETKHLWKDSGAA